MNAHWANMSKKMKKQHYCYSTDITREIQFIDFKILLDFRISDLSKDMVVQKYTIYIHIYI